MSSNIASLRHEIELLNQALEETERRAMRTESMVIRTLGYVNRMSGSDSLSVLINKLMDTMRIADMLIATLTALQVARMAAGDPLAWMQFGVSALGLGVSVSNQMQIRSPQY